MVYKTFKETPQSNLVIQELNAKVYGATFKDKTGIQLGDLYECRNEPKCIVARNTCAPVDGTFIKTIKIEFS